jgi:hypothetical protein
MYYNCDLPREYILRVISFEEFEKNKFVDAELLNWLSVKLGVINEPNNEFNIIDEPLEDATKDYEPISFLTTIHQENLSTLFEPDLRYDVLWTRSNLNNNQDECDLICGICRNEIKQNESIGKLTCFKTHIYHRQCIMRCWKEFKICLCPQCQRQIKFKYPLGKKKVHSRYCQYT